MDGVTFDSKAEARRYQELKLVERAGEMIPIILPFPDSRLSPNARMNHYALNIIRREAREAGFFAVKQNGLRIPDKPIQLFIKICPPDKRRRDDDNILTSLKSYRDGIFDALGINDNRVRLTTFGFGEPIHNGAIYIWIEPLKEIPEWLKNQT